MSESSGHLSRVSLPEARRMLDESADAATLADAIGVLDAFGGLQVGGPHDGT